MQSRRRRFAERLIRWMDGDIGSGLIVMALGAVCGIALAVYLAGG